MGSTKETQNELRGLAAKYDFSSKLHARTSLVMEMTQLRTSAQSLTIDVL